MTINNRNILKPGSWLAGAVMLIILSHLYLDTRIAVFFGELLRKNRLLSTYASDIPDLLFPVAILFTIISWTAYLWLARKNGDNAFTRFFHLTGWTIPLSYLAKIPLKYLFGKVTTRGWLANHELYGFHWFAGRCGYDGFPSGHMVVFTVLTLAVWRFFPRYRYVCAGFLLLLAAALIVTSYHFLSDVLGGALLGVIIDAVVCRFLFPKRENRSG